MPKRERVERRRRRGSRPTASRPCRAPFGRRRSSGRQSQRSAGTSVIASTLSRMFAQNVAHVRRARAGSRPCRRSRRRPAAAPARALGVARAADGAASRSALPSLTSRCRSAIVVTASRSARPGRSCTCRAPTAPRRRRGRARRVGVAARSRGWRSTPLAATRSRPTFSCLRARRAAPRAGRPSRAAAGAARPAKSSANGDGQAARRVARAGLEQRRSLRSRAPPAWNAGVIAPVSTASAVNR